MHTCISWKKKLKRRSETETMNIHLRRHAYMHRPLSTEMERNTGKRKQKKEKKTEKRKYKKDRRQKKESIEKKRRQKKKAEERKEDRKKKEGKKQNKKRKTETKEGTSKKWNNGKHKQGTGNRRKTNKHDTFVFYCQAVPEVLFCQFQKKHSIHSVYDKQVAAHTSK